MPHRRLRADPAPAALLAPVDAHRRRRGPYTAAGTIVRALLPDAVERVPDLVTRHGVEILTVAPETRAAFDSTYAIAASLAPDQETTRFFSRLRTLRLAHGLTEFLRDYVIALGRGQVSLTVRRVDEADPTDQEFLSVLLRRLDPRLITLVVGGTPATGPLAEALARYADRWATVSKAAPVTNCRPPTMWPATAWAPRPRTGGCPIRTAAGCTTAGRTTRGDR